MYIIYNCVLVVNLLFYVLFVCKCVLLPPGVNRIAVNKYINIIYVLMSG